MSDKDIYFADQKQVDYLISKQAQEPTSGTSRSVLPSDSNQMPNDDIYFADPNRVAEIMSQQDQESPSGMSVSSEVGYYLPPPTDNREGLQIQEDIVRDAPEVPFDSNDLQGVDYLISSQTLEADEPSDQSDESVDTDHSDEQQVEVPRQNQRVASSYDANHYAMGKIHIRGHQFFRVCSYHPVL